tara:strand:+ start:7921 stop:8136 length:216 start_codon:yes stop_codon:yes gene_type:complete
MILLFFSKKWRIDKMAEKVAKVGIKKAAGWLYFVDKKGDISRAKMARGGKKKKAKKKKPKRKAKKKKKRRR